MGPPKTVRTISQEAFDEMVKENVEDLDMDPAEALQDAIQTLTLQGVDLSGIVTSAGGVRENPLMQCLEKLKKLDLEPGDSVTEERCDGLVELFDELSVFCSQEGSGNAAVAVKNGGLDVVCSICAKLVNGSEQVLVSGLNAMAALIYDLQCTEIFRNKNGAETVVHILSKFSDNVDVLTCGFSVVATAATGNEVVKEKLMELKIDELIVQILQGQKTSLIHSIYDAIRVLLTPDDTRVVASQVYGYARRFAKIGIAGALVDLLHEGITSPSLVSASIALKSIAVNDEICKSVAESGGIDAVLRCINDSGEQRNETVAKACCSLLSKLAGSDGNKSDIVAKGGMDELIKLATRFSDDPTVLQEIISIFWVLCLRSPENASRAIESGAGDLVIQAMENFPAASQLQKSSCLMIRNLTVRNPENRTILLNNGIEKLIRKAKETHHSCKNAAADALRDLGLDNYNS
uniref:LRRK2 ARM repeat domain-containing protein n=1 Tax=Kalanchoe fedtschenkoi TaxID=63787 RepID=A0A7N0VD33_KALFE